MRKSLYEDYDNIVSIITPAYNSANCISATIESVLRQTYIKWEMIIVDDCSDDYTIDVVRTYERLDDRIKLIRLDKNQGVANARNIGMKCSKGRYIAFLDSDDIWLEKKLECQLAFMKERNIGFSFTQYCQFVDDVKKSKQIIHVPDRVQYRDLLKGNVIGCLTVIIDRQKIPPFNMRKEYHEDYIAWLEILKQGFAAYGYNEDLARYRISSSSVSSNKKKSASWTWNIYRNIEKLSIIESIYYFLWYVLRGISKHRITPIKGGILKNSRLKIKKNYK
ncbi:glycosyltransferase involved in cell wall biosynthesis [Sporomusaceae bacterium BoRhaA]|uniref:glycosyltransferase family 2 protein n=1 Tax=Pelorhabdus rhamnosifermentans TaxID=2772457 RepID=UPI001C063467|nr:glycosyltransferase family 2 protein [Pelorhabdus rhamnosifermentans]MBU2699044.1 glycosyltransferase involved in cell wall biosynthesis [Pelorhabdus rhamnosifermentans]